MSHRQYFTVLAGLLSLRIAVERGRCWKYKKTVVRARARRGRVRAAELAEQLAAGCRMIAARQLDLLLEQLFGAPCVTPCAREAVGPSATTFAKPRGVHQGARRCGDKGNERCPQRRVGAFTAGERDAAHQRLSSPPGWAPLRSRACRGGQRVPSGRTAPRWGRGAGTAPPRAPRTAQASARQAIARPRRAPYLNSAAYLKLIR